MKASCSKCGTEIIAPRTICDVCNELELRINAPRYFGKPIINKTIEWSPYKTDNTVDRWKEKE